MVLFTINQPVEGHDSDEWRDAYCCPGTAEAAAVAAGTTVKLAVAVAAGYLDEAYADGRTPRPHPVSLDLLAAAAERSDGGEEGGDGVSKGDETDDDASMASPAAKSSSLHNSVLKVRNGVSGLKDTKTKEENKTKMQLRSNSLIDSCVAFLSA